MTDWSAIAARIRSETFVRHVEQHVEIGSTNDRALELAADPELPTPAIVLTERQTAGRGRGANVWRSDPGALTFSLLIDPPAGLAPERVPLVSLAAGLAAREAIASAAPGHIAKVKWPNDVYLDGRKVCGILTEVAQSGPTLRVGNPDSERRTTLRNDRVVIGIGVNANNSLERAPEEIRLRAVSVVEALGAPLDLGELLIGLLIRIETELSEICSTGELSVRRWSPHCLLTGRTIRLRTPAGEFSGRCLAIAEDGALLLETDEGYRPFHGGEVVAF